MKAPYAVVLFFALSTVALAQDGFIGAGLALKYTTNTRDTNVPDVYGEFGQKFFSFKDTTLQYRIWGSYSEKPDIADMFTRDNNPDRIATAQLLLRPSVRWNINNASYFNPFFAVGVDYTKHFGLPSAPSQGLNPVFSFGTKIGRKTEIEVRRIFEDKLNYNKFPVQTVAGVMTTRMESGKSKGWGFGGSHEVKLRGSAHLILGAEYSDIVYRGCGNLACDAYREYDGIGRVFVGVRIHRGY